MVKKNQDNMTVKDLKKKSKKVEKEVPETQGISRKYEFTGETIEVDGHTLNRIRSLRSLFPGSTPGTIPKGTLGGFIEDEKCLSHDGGCWVSDDAKVYCGAYVIDNAVVSGDESSVYDECIISGHARVIDSRVSDSCTISGHARVEDSDVTDNCHLYGNINVEYSTIEDDVVVYGNTHILDTCTIKGTCRICADVIKDTEICVENFESIYITDAAAVIENGEITKQRDVFYIPNIGSRLDTTTFFRDRDGDIMVHTGCFESTLAEFSAKVSKIYGGDDEDYFLYYNQYQCAIALAKMVMVQAEDN